MHVVHSKILLATRRVAKNSLWVGLIWGSGGETTSRWEKPPAAGGTGVWSAELPALKNFAFFCKNNLFLGVV